MNRSEDEWQRLEASYCRGVVVPNLQTVEDYVSATISADADLINCVLIKARRQPTLLVALFRALANIPTPSAECQVAFHSAWISQGLNLRETFEVDPFIPAALAKLLPGYSGPAVELFRGERYTNHQSKCYGPSWSSKQAVAERFASGLNRCPKSGGVVLRTIAPANAILASPKTGLHMIEEAEYIVDRRHLQHIEVVQRFPPDSGADHQREQR